MKISSLLGIRNDVAKYRFDNAEESDIRVLSFMKNKATVSGVDYRLFNKFESAVGDSIYSQMMPLIRVSELYLMVSEIYYEQGQ